MDAKATVDWAQCRDLFTPRPGPVAAEAIGAELEFIPIDSLTRLRCPIVDDGRDGGPRVPATLPMLRTIAARGGWLEQPSAYGAPVFVAPDGAVISYEPGGQIEYSAAPATSVSTLVRRLHEMAGVLRGAAERAGIELLSVGIDPHNSIEAVPLQLHGARYTAMDAYFATLGPAGARMMRQTAACQVTLDAGEDPVARWALLSAVAPYVTAIFANSPRYAGAPTGSVSARAQAWRHLDPARTGLPAAAATDPAAAYTAFALEAPAILRRPREGGYRPFGALVASGEAIEADWTPHLTTLFPEVRPRGIAGVATFEIRSADAIAVEWCAALLVLLVGVAYDRTSREDAVALLGSAEPDLLARAAHLGLRDRSMRHIAAELYSVALRGAARLGEAVVGGAELETAQEFGRRFVLRGRSPADDPVVGPLTIGDRADTRSIGGTHPAARG
jgi:glutamate--cysteine ligase